ncbi:MAG: hypothetical protein P1V20_26945 [Verrucomicrobiales bacterium]|nr:hypothetical protein [Verrucomicrobiales bacterium]
MVLPNIHFWFDEKRRDASGQMALDEAAFLYSLESGEAVLRTYTWPSAAVTIGYFDDYPEDEKRPVVRRMTGGGLVEHGEDVTFCLTLPPICEAAKAKTETRYRWIHECLAKVLVRQGIDLDISAEEGAVTGPCFSNPVKWDLLDDCGRKRVGGAQRKSKGGVIHQGSIQIGDHSCIGDGSGKCMRSLAGELAGKVAKLSASRIKILEETANFLITGKYGTDEWCKNRKINSG